MKSFSFPYSRYFLKMVLDVHSKKFIMRWKSLILDKNPLFYPMEFQHFSLLPVLTALFHPLNGLLQRILVLQLCLLCMEHTTCSIPSKAVSHLGFYFHCSPLVLMDTALFSPQHIWNMYLEYVCSRCFGYTLFRSLFIWV